MTDTDPLSRNDADSTDNPVSHLLPNSGMPPEYSVDEGPPLKSPPVEKPSFIRTWLATSTDLRPTSDPTSIEWGVHWYTPVSIVLLLLVGTSTATAHHLIYSMLHEEPVGGALQQRWTSWIGSGLGFLTKVTLTAALGISRTQWVWLTLRKKWFTLNSIDSLFGIISDPTLFLDWTMIRHAKVATVMAFAMWIVPLAAILTPGTISVKTIAITDSVDCAVPTLLFAFDHHSNATPPAIGPNNTFRTPWSWQDEPRGISLHVSVVPPLMLTAYTGTINRLPDLPPVHSSDLGQVESPGRSTLGQECGSNCTYIVQFLGPSLTCAEFSKWKGSKWHNSTQFMDGNVFLAVQNPAGNLSFLVGIFVSSPPQQVVVFECKSSTAYYTVENTIEDRRYREPIITKVETVVLPDFELHPVYPTLPYLPSLGLYTRVYNTLSGQLGGLKSETQSESVNTVLMTDIYGNSSNIGNAIEQLSHRMVVSMVGLDIVFQNHQYTLDIAGIQKTRCDRTENVPVYIYSPQTLLIVYGLAVACALATSVAGFIALGHNGMASTKTVSTIIRTTRNHTLDECIVGGDCLGGDVMSPELQRVKLRFGALKTGKIGTAPFALGVKGEISPIKRD